MRPAVVDGAAVEAQVPPGGELLAAANHRLLQQAVVATAVVGQVRHCETLATVLARHESLLTAIPAREVRRGGCGRLSLLLCVGGRALDHVERRYRRGGHGGRRLVRRQARQDW